MVRAVVNALVLAVGPHLLDAHGKAICCDLEGQFLDLLCRSERRHGTDAARIGSDTKHLTVSVAQTLCDTKRDGANGHMEQNKQDGKRSSVSLTPSKDL